MKIVLTVTMDGIRYHASRPTDCRHCFFWKNRKKGCVLGKENCYYLIEPPKGPSKCEGCPYKRANSSKAFLQNELQAAIDHLEKVKGLF